MGQRSKIKGVQPLLDGVIDYLPSPLDVEQIRGIELKTETDILVKSSDSESVFLLAFKVMNDPFVGSLNIL